ncbi:MAG TPA: hypothetical protein VED84_08785 [Acidimicrobiales bacterium]|nr:hypothetical protein [Acidimicrobiales bacterium]
MAGALACTVVGLSVALATSSSTTTTRFPAGITTPSPFGVVPPGQFRIGRGSFGGGFGFATGGTGGTVDKVSASKFTMTTGTGQKLTVDEQSSTTYREGASAASASAVTVGARVLVRGSTSGSTIKATEVFVLPASGDFFASLGAASTS